MKTAWLIVKKFILLCWIFLLIDMICLNFCLWFGFDYFFLVFYTLIGMSVVCFYIIYTKNKKQKQLKPLTDKQIKKIMDDMNKQYPEIFK
jgi:hypothetical protein